MLTQLSCYPLKGYWQIMFFHTESFVGDESILYLNILDASIFLDFKIFIIVFANFWVY